MYEEENLKMEDSKTLKRVRDAREAIATAQRAMQKAETGLAGVESMAEKTGTVRRHPLAATVVILALGLAGTLTIMGIRHSDSV